MQLEHTELYFGVKALIVLLILGRYDPTFERPQRKIGRKIDGFKRATAGKKRKLSKL